MKESEVKGREEKGRRGEREEKGRGGKGKKEQIIVI